MMMKTEVYCTLMLFEPPVEVMGIMCHAGWYMSELAEEDMYKYLWLN